MFGESGDGLVEIGPWRGGSDEVQGGRDLRGKCGVKTFVVEVVREGGASERALEEEAAFGAFLRGAGELLTGGGINDVVEFGTCKAECRAGVGG